MKNREGRKLLEERYGKGCFMERAGIRIITPEQEKELRKIKGYKKLNRNISYHHIREKSKGGKVSIENGANLAVYNHEWLHQQEPDVIEAIDRRLQDFKLSIDVFNIKIKNKLEVENSSSINSKNNETISIPLYDNTSEDIQKINKKFNRAKEKQITKKLIEEELYR